MFHDLGAGDIAIGGDTDHNGNHTGKALTLRLEHITGAVARTVGGQNIFGGDGHLLKIGSFRQNGQQRRIGLVRLGGINNRLGELVGACQRRGNHYADGG